ncbi:broad specificity 5'(3')-nucleotidase and polyphosphatase [Azospirillaceae bacterium]
MKTDATPTSKRLRILLTNDDGVQAPGLAVLERVARSLTDDVWIAAPETEQSGASHSLTLQRPLRLRRLDDRRFAIDGTPTDCVMLAVNHILADHKPDLVLSGVNFGSNIGDDVTYSGTIAAAMEATLLGARAIALSQHITDPIPHSSWAATEGWAAQTISRILATPWAPQVLMNVNFPACAAEDVRGVQVVRHGQRKIGDELIHRVDPRGKSYFWIGPLRGGDQEQPDTDIAAIQNGFISITPLHLNLTHTATVQSLRQAFQ